MSQHIFDGSLGFLLNRGTQSLHRKLNRNFHENKLDITYEQWSILIYLYLTGQRIIHDLLQLKAWTIQRREIAVQELRPFQSWSSLQLW